MWVFAYAKLDSQVKEHVRQLRLAGGIVGYCSAL